MGAARPERRCVMADRWIRMPGPGQMRGEGEWVEYFGTDDEWEWLQGTGYLPTAEGEKPEGCEVQHG